MFGRIFKFARSIVESSIGQILKQVNIVEEQATAPVRNMVNSVTGGIWRGDGADRFVEEMTNDVIPLLVGITGLNSGYANSIKKSMDIMEQAEKQAASAAQQLFDVFNSIF